MCACRATGCSTALPRSGKAAGCMRSRAGRRWCLTEAALEAGIRRGHAPAPALAAPVPAVQPVARGAFHHAGPDHSPRPFRFFNRRWTLPAPTALPFPTSPSALAPWLVSVRRMRASQPPCTSHAHLPGRCIGEGASPAVAASPTPPAIDPPPPPTHTHTHHHHTHTPHPPTPSLQAASPPGAC